MTDDETKVLLRRIKEVLNKPDRDMDEVREVIEPVQDESVQIPVKRHETLH